jgi:murein DD-endopeptidase MepM/ murein hydrolase activator NlpD
MMLTPPIGSCSCERFMAIPNSLSLIARRRLVGGLSALVIVASIAPGISAASTKDELDAAKQQYETAQGRIAAKQDQLDALEAEANQMASDVAGAQAKLDGIENQLAETRTQLEEARDRYESLRVKLDSRAREAFMGGSSGTISVLLQSSSFAELSDRLEFVNELTAADSDLALAVNNLGVQLEQEEQQQEALRAEQVKALTKLRNEQARLESHLASQQALYDEILAEEREAKQLVDELGRQYRKEQAAAAAAAAAAERDAAPIGGGGGPFSACPVPGGAISDDFGAPRYGGGYHTHEGNDIFAPEGTPIHAPFDGTASGANNTLGGISVIVTGSQGYAYNAHMSRTAGLGAVQAGDVIGYVGSTGDAQGTSPHDHFEWHPGNGAAVDPHPYLLQVC